MVAAAACLGLLAVAGPPIDLQDRWGRSLLDRGVELVDWDGPIANPAMTVTVRATERLQAPARVTIRCEKPLVEFELYSTFGPEGSEKVVFLQDGRSAVSFRLRLVPYASQASGSLELTVDDANEHRYTVKVPWRSVAVPPPPDPMPAPPALNVVASFDQDATGFLADPRVRDVVRQALWSWTHYLADPGFDEVPAGSQSSWVFEPDSFDRGWWQPIAEAYRGFHLFVQGIHSPLRRSGGAASSHPSEQTIRGRPVGFRRSGTVILETGGNYNELGWQVLDWDVDAWRASNQSAASHDLYSICRHEVGHALGFHRVHPAYARLAREGRFRGPRVRKYVGYAPAADPTEHFVGTVDPSSGSGVFGNEYGGLFPRKRWYVTKLDLLAMADLGYGLQNRDAFWSLGCGDVRFRPAERVQTARAWGGVPPYRFRSEGAWPSGLSIDDQTGAIRWDGSASSSGSFAYSVEDQLGAKARGRVTVPKGVSALSPRPLRAQSRTRIRRSSAWERSRDQRASRVSGRVRPGGA